MALSIGHGVVDRAKPGRRGQVDLDLFARLSARRTPETGLSIRSVLHRLLDIVVVVATAPLTLTAIAIAALLIRREDGGPVLFTQERIGRGGQAFTIYKLRTMRAAAKGASSTAVQDTRITRVGAALRRYRIDELPQIWNVLRGDMAVCGPRPEARDLAARYARAIPHYHERHAVRPGITGWAQVRQGYAAGIAEATEKLRYDLYYVVNRSVWLDLKILVMTVATLIRGDGAR